MEHQPKWWHDEPAAPTPLKRAIKVLLIASLCLFVVIKATLAFRESRRRERMRVTLQHFRKIGGAFERFEPAHLPCIRQGAALPASMMSGLTPDTLRDGWGRPIITLSAPGRYVVMSLGSDGRPEPRYDRESFDGDTGDLIYSNGEWLRHPSDLATTPEIPPRPAAALAEVAQCGAAPKPQPPISHR